MAEDWSKYEVDPSKEDWSKYEVKEAPEEEPPGKAMSAFSGLGQGATFGFGDELAGGVGASIESILSDDSKPFIERYHEARDFARNLNLKAKEANPKTYLAANVLGSVASTAPLGGGQAFGRALPNVLGKAGSALGLGAKAAGLGKIGQAFATGVGETAPIGAAYGLGASNDATYGGNALDALKGAGIAGAVGGPLKSLRPVGAGLQSFAETRAPRALGAIKSTAQKMGPERYRQFGRMLLDKGIVGPGANSESMLAKSQALKDSGKTAMNAAFDQADEIGNAFVPERAAQQIESELGGQYRSPLNKDVTSQLDNMLESVRMRNEADPVKQMLKDSVRSARADENLMKEGARTNIESKMQGIRDEIDTMMENAITPVQKNSAKLFKRQLEDKLNNLHELGVLIDSSGKNFKLDDLVAQRFKEHSTPEELQSLLEAVGKRKEMAQQSAAYDSPDKTVSLRQAQGLKEELQRVGYPKGQAPLSPSDKQLMSQDATRIVRDQMDEAANSLLGHEGRSLLQQGRQEYGFGKQSVNLAKSKMASESVKGFGSDLSLTNAPFKVIKATVGRPNAQAWMGDKIGEILQRTPESFGRFAPVLQNAAQRGPAAVNSVVYVLSQQDQEFRELQRQLNEQKE